MFHKNITDIKLIAYGFKRSPHHVQVLEKSIRHAFSIIGWTLWLPLCWSVPCRITLSRAAVCRKAFAMTNPSPIFRLYESGLEKNKTLCFWKDTQMLCGQQGWIWVLEVVENSSVSHWPHKPTAPGGHTWCSCLPFLFDMQYIPKPEPTWLECLLFCLFFCLFERVLLL